MSPLLYDRRLDAAALAELLEGLRTRGASAQAYLGEDVCVTAVNAGERRVPAYSEAASRRASARGRRLLPVIASGAVDGRCWIAYDMGGATALPDCGLLPTATCHRVLSDVARALDDAAARGLYASELPPASVFVHRKGARLGDLGTAREALTGARFRPPGDPAHVPPEVLRGKRAGERSGVYLFGALLRVLLAPASPSRRLPASIDAVVTAATADDPEGRPRSASETREMATRALRGEPPMRSGRARRRAAAPKAGAPEAATKAATAKPATAKPAAPKAKAPAEPAAVPEPAPASPAASPTPAPARRPRPSLPAGRLRSVAVGGAVVLGAAAGLLLGRSSDRDLPPTRTLDAGALSVSVRAEPGSGLRARAAGRPVSPAPGARPVRLGAIEAWRSSSEGVVTYEVPTTRGALVLTCGPAGPARLRRCERAASTARLRGARPLPVPAVRHRRRLHASLAALTATREHARARLGRATTPEDQHQAARALAGTYARTARSLAPLTVAEPVAEAARAASGAYLALAESASSGSAGAWDEAGERVRLSEAALAEAIARVS